MSENRPFGVVLRGLRQRAGLTMEELAEASGVSPRAISNMERGRSRVPQRRTVAALVEGLGLAGADGEGLLAAARAARPTRGAPVTGAGVPPRSVGDFTGREGELERLREAAERSGAGVGGSVVVVSGPPGCGKTTLALKAASDLAEFPDGCFVVDLHGVDGPVDPDEALLQLLKALGVSDSRLEQEDSAGHAGLLRALLSERRCLVVLDNARDEGQVRALLPAGGSSMVLVTSRRPLTGLENVDRLTLAEMTQDEAVELLRRILGTERADAEPEAVMRVAELCGCLPLALRVAGNWLTIRSGWSVAHLVRRLTDEERRLGALAAGDVRVEATFELSYRQLTDQAAGMLRLLSLVPGPDMTAAYGAALTAIDLFEAEDVMEELVEAGLLQATHTGRYQLHDLLRLFARTRLSREDELSAREAAEDRLLNWLLETAAAAGSWFTPQDEALPVPQQGLVPLESREQARAWLESEAPAWYAALRIAADRGEHTRVVETAHAMIWCAALMLHRANWPEVYRLSSQAAAALDDSYLQAVHLNHYAWALTSIRALRHREAIERADQALEHARRAQDASQQAWARGLAAWAHHQLNEFQAAADKALDAATILEAAGDTSWLGSVSIYGSALRFLGRAEEALAQHERIITFLDAPDCPVSEFHAELTRAQTTIYIGRDYMALGRWREAVDHLRSGLLQLRRIGYPYAESGALVYLGEALIELGETGEGRSCLQQALAFGDTASSRDLKKAQEFLDSLPVE